jgi:hypothetical protein
VTDQLNEWDHLLFHDPAVVLPKLRAVEHALAEIEVDHDLARLRTNGLKSYREARDAALFTYGMSSLTGRTIYLAPVEKSDYDFVTLWQEEGTRYFQPVQLKELVPHDLNPSATLERLFMSIRRKYPKQSSTALVIKLGRAGQFPLQSMQLTGLPFMETWYLWAASPDQSRWEIYGLMDGAPVRHVFEYPRVAV